jgi:hypothetical protein
MVLVINGGLNDVISEAPLYRKSERNFKIGGGLRPENSTTE